VVTPTNALATDENVGVDYDAAFAITVINNEPRPADVRVEGGTLAASERLTVGPGEARTLRLPWIDGLAQIANVGEPVRAPTSAWILGGAYRVSSDVPVSVIQRSPGDCPSDPYGCGGSDQITRTLDWSPLVATRALGAQYLVATRPSEAYVDESLSPRGLYAGFVAMVGVATDTRVQVRLTAATAAGPSESPRAAGETLTRTLGPGDVWLLVSEGPSRERPCLAVEGDQGRVCDLREADLTGTEILATAPVAVFAGHTCANVPFTSAWCDHLEAQLLPTARLGTRYVLVGTGRATSMQLGVARIVASRDGTAVTIGDETLTLDRAQWVERTWSGVTELRASAPVLVVQFTPSMWANDSAAGDPSMFVALPESHWRTQYPILVPEIVAFPAPFEWSTLHAVMRRGDSPLFDGTPPEIVRVESLGDEDVFEVRLRTPGAHTVSSARGEPFGLTVSILGPSVGIGYAPL
jgi:hypothetical protein